MPMDFCKFSIAEIRYGILMYKHAFVDSPGKESSLILWKLQLNKSKICL